MKLNIISRTTAVLLTLVLLFSTITGCSPKNEPIPGTGKDSITEGKPDISTGATGSETVETPIDPPIEPDPVPDDVVLVIYGNAVNGQTNWTLEQLQEISDGYREIVFSTTNNWPTYSYMTGHGISIIYLLDIAGIQETAKSITFYSPDGYKATLTRDQVYETRYSYSKHSIGSSSGAVEVEPIIAWEWGEKSVDPENLRPIFGQKGPREVNTSSSVKDLYRIEVSTQDTGVWDIPGTDVKSGSVIAKGSGIELTHPNMDNIKLYYTLDGSDPDYTSDIYNLSTSYFQPDLIKPLIIDKDTVIKVFAGGLGKADSEVVTFTYSVG